jgi:hypothetical protein
MTKLQYTKKNKAQKTKSKVKSKRFNKFKNKTDKIKKSKTKKYNYRRKCGCQKSKKRQKGGKTFFQAISKAFTFGKVDNILKDIEIKLLELLEIYYNKQKSSFKEKNKKEKEILLKNLKDSIKTFKNTTIPNIKNNIKQKIKEKTEKTEKTKLIQNIKTNLKEIIINTNNGSLLSDSDILKNLVKDSVQTQSQPQSQPQQPPQLQQPQQQPPQQPKPQQPKPQQQQT